MIEITTDRLLIRDHIEEDLDVIHELFSDEKSMFYLPKIRTKSKEETKAQLQLSIDEAHSMNRTKFFFAIIDRKTKTYIGEIGITKVLENTDGHVMDLGYFIKESFWGNGIVTEASKAVINYAFNHLNTIKIKAGCIVDNKGSEKVMLKLGMLKETELRNHVTLASKFYDRVIYRLLKEEWLLNNGCHCPWCWKCQESTNKTSER